MKPDTTLVPMLQQRGFKPVARLRPQHARDIAESPWGIGCETIDRDYVDFAQTCPHLGELGAKRARLQAGWAKCEPAGDGKYDWQWLDDVVNGCVAQGVMPWLETSYGHPLYEGGGGIGLAEGFPKSETALAAWDRWVHAMATRYHDRVSEWEIWNEPDLRKVNSPEGYTALFIRTATIIRAIQPKAFIIGLAIAGDIGFAEEFLTMLAAAGKTDLLNEITFHFYPHNPDDAFEAVERLGRAVAQHARGVKLAQGETGAPSETRKFMALGDHDWNERKQVAWDLRRLLAHHARGHRMSLFQLADMHYSKKKGIFEGRNPKGMLSINPDLTVAYRKPVYFAAQHVFTLLDGRYPLVALENRAAGQAARSYAFAWQRAGADLPDLMAWWRADAPPALETPELGTIALEPVALRDPVMVDLTSGVVFEMPAVPWSALPCGDVPLALAERGVLPLRGLED